MNASAILGGIGLLVSAGVFGDAAARDVSTRMHALFYTSPLRERHYVVGRFLGAIAINAVLLLGVPLGLLLASVMPYMEAGKFGPVQIAAYVQAYVLMLLAESRAGRRMHVRRGGAHASVARDLCRRHRTVRARHHRRQLTKGLSNRDTVVAASTRSESAPSWQ